METAEKHRFIPVITSLIRQNVAADVFNWIEDKGRSVREENGSAQLNLAFAAAPRKTGRKPVKLSDDDQKIIEGIHKGFSIADWTTDRLTRLWLILQVDSTDKNNYCSKIENLFNAAEMNELAALYSSLYFLEYAAEWKQRCAEGVRSNIGLVLEAIMYNNPYPSIHLSDSAWNQLVMKAFFTEKDVNRIIGLDERANKELAWILIDYANERWAAHRAVNPQLWRLVSKFIDEKNFRNIEKAFKSFDTREKKAAALTCYNSNYPEAKKLLDTEPEIKSSIIEGNVSWNTI